MSTHERVYTRAYCERCGDTGHEHTSARRGSQEWGWVQAGRGKRERVFGLRETGATHRGARWGVVCDECWQRELAKADALADKRAAAAAVRMGVLAQIVAHENASA
jgi:hypothetical protein